MQDICNFITSETILLKNILSICGIIEVNWKLVNKNICIHKTVLRNMWFWYRTFKENPGNSGWYTHSISESAHLDLNHLMCWQSWITSAEKLNLNRYITLLCQHFCTLTIYKSYSSPNINREDDEMGRQFGIHDRWEVCTQKCWSKNLKRHLGYLGTDWRIILRWILKTSDGEQIAFNWLMIGTNGTLLWTW
jgi:hypothetical protein